MLNKAIFRTFLVVAMCCSQFAHAQSDVGAAVGLGGNKGVEIFNNTKTQQPTADTVPGFNGANQSQQQYYENGQGNIVGPGAGKASGCTSQNDPECIAVNLLQWGPNNRPKPTFNANDPLISGAKDKLKNPAATVGSFAVPGGSTAGVLTNATGQCQQVTTTTPATYKDNICDENAQISSNLCALMQVVKVDARYDFKCEKTTESKSELNCSRTLNVACVGAPPTYTCVDGSTPLNGMCSATTSTTSPAEISGYTCPVGTVLSGNQCVLTTTVPATVGSYTCPAGQVVSGASCLLTTSSPATPIYSCPAGSTLSGSDCISSNNVSTPAQISNYSCPAGQTVSGNSCLSTTSSAATPVYSCSLGFTLVASNCVQTTNSAATPVYSCPAGATLVGSNCNTTVTSSASITYLCPSRTSLGGPKNGYPQSCYASFGGGPYNFAGWTYITIDYAYWLIPRTQYSCPAGQIQSGSTCYATVSNPASISSYTCPVGTVLSGNQCVLTTTVPATVGSYTCPAGQVVSGASCLLTTSSPATPIYSCPAGSTLSGSDCISSNNVSTPAQISNYSCPAGQTVSGNSCLSTTSSAATPVYSCSLGFTLVGSNCVQTTNSAATPVYSCLPGGVLSGSQCIYAVTTTSNATESYSCSSGSLTTGAVVNNQQTYVCCTESINNACEGLEGLAK